MNYVVITGVSSGIGYATTAELVRRGYFVFGSVRKPNDAERLQAEFKQNFVPLLFDVTDHAAIETAVSQVTTAIGDNGLLALINNAGISTPGPLMHMPLDDFRFQFEVNVFAQLDITQQFLPLLGASKGSGRPPGRIINISSISGKIVYPFMGAYAGSKHAFEAVSDALRRELMLYGIDVITIEPGTVQTPIVGKFAEQVKQYEKTDYGAALESLQDSVEERERTAIPVERVVKIIVEALEKERPRARYAIPRRWLTSFLLPRWLPDRWFDRIIAGRLGLDNPQKSEKRSTSARS